MLNQPLTVIWQPFETVVPCIWKVSCFLFFVKHCKFPPVIEMVNLASLSHLLCLTWCTWQYIIWGLGITWEKVCLVPREQNLARIQGNVIVCTGTVSQLMLTLYSCPLWDSSLSVASPRWLWQTSRSAAFSCCSEGWSLHCLGLITTGGEVSWTRTLAGLFSSLCKHFVPVMCRTAQAMLKAVCVTAICASLFSLLSTQVCPPDKYSSASELLGSS